jgi:hypothetical protein
VAYRGEGLAHGRHRRRVERIVLALDRPTLTRVPPIAREALGDEAAYARLARGGQQRVGALCPKPVGLGEAAVEMLEVAQIRQGGRLMDDRLGLGLEDGLAHGTRVEQVERDRLRPERPYPLGVSTRPRGADHLVAPINELRNEPGADRTARSRYEDSHDVSFPSHRPDFERLVL